MVLRDIHESLLHGGKTTVPEYGMMERFLDLGVKNQAVSSKSLLVRSDCSPRSHPKPANTTWSVTARLMSLFFLLGSVCLSESFTTPPGRIQKATIECLFEVKHARELSKQARIHPADCSIQATLQIQSNPIQCSKPNNHNFTHHG